LFNEFIAKEYSKFISFKSHLIGSFRNNSVKIKNKIKYKNSILFISQTPNKPFAYKNLKINPKNNVNFWIEEKLLIIIKNYCMKNKVNLYILGKHREKQIKINEKKYYLNLLKSNFKYIYAKQNNYSLIDKFETILTINSTLGYESLARKKKCLFFNNRKINKKRISSNFWPFKIKDHGNFYSKFTDEKVVNEILSKNININYKTWYNKNKKLVSKFQYFDYQNKKFKFLINSYLNV